MNEKDREDYKEMLGCLDEQIDAILDAIYDAETLGVSINVREFFLFLSNQKRIFLLGESVEEPIGILESNKK